MSIRNGAISLVTSDGIVSSASRPAAHPLHQNVP